MGRGWVVVHLILRRLRCSTPITRCGSRYCLGMRTTPGACWGGSYRTGGVGWLGVGCGAGGRADGVGLAGAAPAAAGGGVGAPGRRLWATGGGVAAEARDRLLLARARCTAS